MGGWTPLVVCVAVGPTQQHDGHILTDLYIYILDAVPPIAVANNDHLQKLSYENGGLFPDRAD